MIKLDKKHAPPPSNNKQAQNNFTLQIQRWSEHAKIPNGLWAYDPYKSEFIWGS